MPRVDTAGPADRAVRRILVSGESPAGRVDDGHDKTVTN